MIYAHLNHSGTTTRDRLTTNIPIVTTTATLSDVQALFWKRMGAFDTIKIVHVVDEAGTFVGVFTSGEIFRHPPHTPVVSILMPAAEVCILRTTDDQEQAVKQALHQDAESVVIVDEDHKLVGAISIKELLKILLEETQEDLAAVGSFDMSPRLDSILEIPLWEAVKNRTPWILAGLMGGVGVAFIVSTYDELLSTHLILASYIPLAVYITGAVSAQIQMNYIRDLAFYPTLPLRQYIAKQALVVAALALLISGVLLLISLYVRDLGDIAYLIAVGIGTTVFSALFTGIAVPTLLARLVKDPANATAPIATIISDALTIVIFFSIATIWL